MGDYQVLFSGEVSRKADVNAVRDRLAHELGIDDRKAKQLFTGRTVVIRSQLSQDEAQELQLRLEGLGALCRVKSLALPAGPTGPTIDKDASRLEGKNVHTLKDITAAHIECPRCGHMQLESSHCAKCGVDITVALAQKRKEDLLIEKKIRELRSRPEGKGQAPVLADKGPAKQAEALITETRVLDRKRSGFIRGLFKKSS